MPLGFGYHALAFQDEGQIFLQIKSKLKDGDSWAVSSWGPRDEKIPDQVRLNPTELRYWVTGFRIMLV